MWWGGAGYIGSHMVRLALDQGHAVSVLDNLCGGFRDAVDARANFILGDIGNRELMLDLLARQYDGVMHFASYIQVGESMANPAKYYRNNLVNSMNILDAMVAAPNTKFIFSSSAAVYGNPQYSPIDERHPLAPINPYGRTKLMFEQALSDYDHAYGLKSVALRYFNAAGAAPDSSLGERHDPETHLIPLVLQAALGQREGIDIYGDDYDTPDGTCIRDYVHVMDLCDAHLAALEWLLDGGESMALNLGSTTGNSVREVIDVATRVTGRGICVRNAPRRLGDPAILVADAGMARKKLNWMPNVTNIEQIVFDAWRWHARL